MIEALLAWMKVESSADLAWLAIGLGAQLMFSARFWLIYVVRTE